MSPSQFSILKGLLLCTALAACAVDPETGALAGSAGSSGSTGLTGSTGSTGTGAEELASDEVVVTSPAAVSTVSAAIEAPTMDGARADEVEPPLAHRIARKTILVFAEPRWNAEIRGRIDMGQPFEIYEPAEGKGCTGEGWARVGAQGFACLRDSEPSERSGKTLPVVPAGRVVPFTYAKARADKAGQLLAPVPRFRSLTAMVAGEQPLDWLQPHHQYAFVESRRVAEVGLVLFDRNRRVVAMDGLELERPSKFAGRELGQRPVPEGVVAAWSAEMPTPVRAAPGLAAPLVGRVEYHREIHVEPTPVRVDGIDWYALRDDNDDSDSPAGFVSDEDIRRWIPGEPLADVRADELWIDVELGEQTLTLLRGAEPVFVTLISSGAGDNPTPRGVFRIWHKQALGDMRSLPGDADSYTVEDVPWVQYFHRRFALHTAFWHNKFGRKRSHGCINLSPRDAARLFGQTSPTMPPGWTFVYEHEDDRGTSVRIRKGVAPVPDRRSAIGDADEVDVSDVADTSEDEVVVDAAAP